MKVDFSNGIIVQFAVIIVVVGVISLIGIFIMQKIDDKTALQSTFASGTLTFTNNVTNGETVTIGSDVFEFSTDGTVGAGNILVWVTPDSEGMVNQTIAIANLTTVINANSAVVSAVAS